MSDLSLDREYQRGDRGKKVRLIQEWLCLDNINIPIDGDFGPATEAAVRKFQENEGLAVNGVVGETTFSYLIRPMTQAIAEIPADGKSLGKMIVEYANQHVVQHPREIGGQNRGPWVRLYMNGNEGTPWAWCAGFACYILKQACHTLDISPPITPSFSCDSLAADAKQRGVFLKESQVEDKTDIAQGSIFLVRRTSTDWTHTGIVTSTGDDCFETIEGNTNDEGNREGYEVCERIRGYKKKDFIVF
jgi:hypothetical protein